MKLTTMVWVGMRSVGRPEFDARFYGDVKHASRKIIEWLCSCYMGQRLEIRVARTEIELMDKTSRVDVAMDNDFDAMFESIALEAEQNQQSNQEQQ